MIISHKYKYLFLEVPRTGTTAISDQLVKLYDGKEILIKHGNYRDFKRFYGNKYDDYFVFSGVRNPLDRTVSLFQKISNKNFTPDSKWFFKGKVNFLKNNSSYEDYFLKFYNLPYDDWASLDHHKFDYIIRFENLQQDFSKVLGLLNIDQVQEIPVIRPTKNKKNYIEYYTPKTQKRALNIFGPYCQKFDYDFPWGERKLSSFYIFLYKCLFPVKKALWIYSSNKVIKSKLKSGEIKL